MFYSLVNPVYAEVNIGNEFGPAKTFPSFGALINVLLPNIFTVAGLIAFVFVVFAGLNVIRHAGQGEGEQAAKDQQALTAAIIGLLLIFTAYFIVQVVSTVLGYNILSPKLINP